MVSIYCIEDINHLKYVGSTKRKLYERLSNHKTAKKKNKYCSSSKLDLSNCKIFELERCDEEDRKERERYWINNTDCVNEKKLNGHDREKLLKKWRKNNKKWKQNNKEKIKDYNKKYRQNNKEKINEHGKESRHYKNTWGGDNRSNNNLLKIDVNLFQ